MAKINSIPAIIRELEFLRAKAIRTGMEFAQQDNSLRASYCNGLDVGYRMALGFLKNEFEAKEDE